MNDIISSNMILNKEEKMQVINTHIEGLLFAKDISNLYILEEKKKENPSEEFINKNIYNLQQIEKQIEILQQQINLLN